MANRTLKKEVAGKYRVLEGHGVGEYHFKGQSVHLDALDLPEADELVANGFPYLVPLPDEKKAKPN